MVFPWEEKAAQLAVSESVPRQSSNKWCSMERIKEMPEPARMLLLRSYFIWKLTIIASGLQIAAAITIFCAQFTQYSSFLKLILPAMITSIISPLYAWFTWHTCFFRSLELVGDQGMERKVHRGYLAGFTVALILHLGWLTVTASGWPVEAGGVGFRGMLVALTKNRLLVAMVAGISGCINVFVVAISFIFFLSVSKRI